MVSGGLSIRARSLAPALSLSQIRIAQISIRFMLCRNFLSRLLYAIAWTRDPDTVLTSSNQNHGTVRCWLVLVAWSGPIREPRNMGRLLGLDYRNKILIVSRERARVLFEYFWCVLNWFFEEVLRIAITKLLKSIRANWMDTWQFPEIDFNQASGGLV